MLDSNSLNLKIAAPFRVPHVGCRTVTATAAFAGEVDTLLDPARCMALAGSEVCLVTGSIGCQFLASKDWFKLGRKN